MKRVRRWQQCHSDGVDGLEEGRTRRKRSQMSYKAYRLEASIYLVSVIMDITRLVDIYIMVINRIFLSSLYPRAS